MPRLTLHQKRRFAEVVGESAANRMNELPEFRVLPAHEQYAGLQAHIEQAVKSYLAAPEGPARIVTEG